LTTAPTVSWVNVDGRLTTAPTLGMGGISAKDPKDIALRK